jgi:ubiquinone/menaquinone biosynthesis C-methylase UbiE
MRREVERLFDAMAHSYDELEPWYEHLYTVLHAILRAELEPRDGRRPCALDAGCGSGFQSALLEDLGYDTHGVDISPALLALARRRLQRSTLTRASIEALPYRDHCFDAVCCGGSTLSFVEAPGQALREFGRVLRPGGTLLLECEHKWSLDLAWALVSSLTFDSLGYGVSPVDVWRQLARPLAEGIELDYPGYGTLRLYTLSELGAMLREAGLTTLRLRGIHTITNLIPSTVLHRARLGRPLARLYRWLRILDRALVPCSPAARLANSVVIVARKDCVVRGTNPR